MATPGIEIRSMRPEDGDQARQILCQEYMVHEPLGISLQVQPERDGTTLFNTVFPGCLEEGLSVVAVDSASGKLAGVRLSGIVHKGKPDIVRFSTENPNTRNLALTYEPVDALYKSVDVFAKYGVDKLVNFRCLCVAKEYQRQGIATKMIVKCMELAKEKGFQLVTVEATSRFSARIFEKYEFDKLVELRYDSMIVGGQPLPMTDELKLHERFILFAKLL